MYFGGITGWWSIFPRLECEVHMCLSEYFNFRISITDQCDASVCDYDSFACWYVCLTRLMCVVLTILISYERQVDRCCKGRVCTSVWWETKRIGFWNVTSFPLSFSIFLFPFSFWSVLGYVSSEPRFVPCYFLCPVMIVLTCENVGVLSIRANGNIQMVMYFLAKLKHILNHSAQQLSRSVLQMIQIKHMFKSFYHSSFRTMLVPSLCLTCSVPPSMSNNINKPQHLDGYVWVKVRVRAKVILACWCQQKRQDLWMAWADVLLQKVRSGQGSPREFKRDAGWFKF